MTSKFTLSRRKKIMGKSENVYIDEEERIIWLMDGIDHNTASKLGFYLVNLIAKDDKYDKEQKNYERKPIKLYINSYGGLTDPTLSIVDIILESKTPIHTYCTGYAYSSGFLLFIAGNKRYMTQNAELMYHQVSASEYGEIKRLMDMAKYLEGYQNRIEQYVARQTKITLEKLKEIRDMKTDLYISREDAVKYGVIEE